MASHGQFASPLYLYMYCIFSYNYNGVLYRSKKKALYLPPLLEVSSAPSPPSIDSMLGSVASSFVVVESFSALNRIRLFDGASPESSPAAAVSSAPFEAVVLAWPLGGGRFSLRLVGSFVAPEGDSEGD